MIFFFTKYLNQIFFLFIFFFSCFVLGGGVGASM